MVRFAQFVSKLAVVVESNLRISYLPQVVVTAPKEAVMGFARAEVIGESTGDVLDLSITGAAEEMHVPDRTRRRGGGEASSRSVSVRQCPLLGDKTPALEGL
jgi:hypothetical protein